MPLWHEAVYGIEAWSARNVYGWAHLFAIYDCITKNTMHWNPSGSKMKIDLRYVSFRVLQTVFNFIPACAWVYISADKMVTQTNLYFLPMLLSGIYYLTITFKTTFYLEPSAVKPFKRKHKIDLAPEPSSMI